MFVVPLLLFASDYICHCLEYGADAGTYWSEKSGSPNFFEPSSNTKLQEDIKLIREILPDKKPENDPLSEPGQFLQQAVNTEYATLISNLALENEQSFADKINAIRRALESAFLNTRSGVIDYSFVDGIITTIKNEVVQKRRRDIHPYQTY